MSGIPKPVDGDARRLVRMLTVATTADHVATAPVAIPGRGSPPSRRSRVATGAGFGMGDQSPPLLALLGGAIGKMGAQDDGEPWPAI